MSDNKSLKYTVNNESLFANAEPYHYGEGSPNVGYFLPVGEDNNESTTNDFKIQKAETNGYSKIKYLDAFKINNHSIAYIEAGTFPLPREVHSFESTEVAAGNYDFYNLKITYKNAKIISIIGETYSRSQSIPIYDTTDRTVKGLVPKTLYNSETEEGVLYTDLKHGNEEFPKRLGFILVSGGGGCGGGGRYDPDKNKKGSSGDYVVPGGGGGGGGAVYGVLDISYEAAKKIQNIENPTELVYYVKLGTGGYAGENKISSEAASGGYDGLNGGNGSHSVLYVKKPGFTNPLELIKAGIGLGGGGAKNHTFGSGGEGGSGIWFGLDKESPKSETELADQYNCIIRGTIAGGKGGHVMADSETNVTNDKVAFSVYFSETLPPSQQEYLLSRTHAATVTTYSTTSNTSASIFKTPGGHSFGNGAEADRPPTKGGGGGCFETNYRSGAGGYFGLYY
jgi:hypothetical protein